MAHEAAAVSFAGITFSQYKSETQLPAIIALIDKDLSEPYSIYTYRYFVSLFPELCVLAFDGPTIIGVIVGRIIEHRLRKRGYIAMLAVDKKYRAGGIGCQLARQEIQILSLSGVDEIVLEAEESNTGALNLYRRLGFVRDKKLPGYYLNGSDAYRLKLWLR